MLNYQTNNEKGSVIILVALMITVLLGCCAIVVDIGIAYAEKAKLQNAVDAAALAGGLELPAKPNEAITIANNFAAENGKSDDEVTPTVTNDNKVLRVSTRRQVQYYFARIFGMNNSDITATAAVTLSTVGSVSGAVPLGVEKQTFVYGQPYTLKYGGGSGNTGNYGALALGTNGANVFENNLKYGYSGTITIGQSFDIETETGNIRGKTDIGTNYRINQDPTATFDTVQRGSPRIVVIPVTETMDLNGKKPVTVVGFAVFFLTSSSSGVITGCFMDMVIENSTSGSGTNYGAYKLKLTE